GQRRDEAEGLAGGQRLIPMMKLRFAFPELLVDVNRVPGLDAIDDAEGHLRVGALVRHNDVVGSDVVTRANHTMAAAPPWVSDPLFRNPVTVCGSIAHAEPVPDSGSLMLSHESNLV